MKTWAWSGVNKFRKSLSADITGYALNKAPFNPFIFINYYSFHNYYDWPSSHRTDKKF